MTGTKFLTFVAFMVIASSAQAQERRRTFEVAPYVALVAGQGADVWTKKVALHRGCVEANTYAYRSQVPTTARLIGTKTLMVGSAVVAMSLLQRHGHPTAARWLGYFGAGIGGSIAAWNLSIECQGSPR